MIVLKIENKELDLVQENANILQSFQTNDIDKPTTVQSNYSNTFRIPETKRNNEIFNFANTPASLSEFPYIFRETQLLKNGIEINAISILFIDKYIYNPRGQNFYEARLFSGNLNLFEVIAGKSIRNLDLSLYNHFFNQATILNSQNNTADIGGYVYDIQNTGKVDSLNTGLYSDLTPSIFAINIIKQIFIDAGFSFSLPDNEEYKKYLVPYTNEVQPFQEERNDFERVRRVNADSLSVLYIARPNYRTSTNRNLPFFDPFSGFWDNPNRWYVDSSISLKLTIEAEIIHGDGEGEFGALVNQDNNNPVFTQFLPPADPTTGTTTNIKFEYFLQAGDTISFQIIRLTGAANRIQVSQNSKLRIRVQPVTPLGLLWEFAPNLPDISQSDFLKEYALRFGWLFQFDDYERKVLIKEFDDILNKNANNAVNFSDKVDLSKQIELNYRLNSWAKTNNFKFSGEEQNLSGVLLVVNDTLQEETTIFESKFFETTETEAGFPSPEVKRFELTEESTSFLETAVYNIINPEPRLLYYVGQSSQPYDIFFDPYYVGPPVNISNPVRLSTQNTSFQFFIDNYYRAQKSILNKTKIYRIFLKLSEVDIKNLDYTKPVFIDIYASGVNIRGLFYINFIEQFDNGQNSCRVKLALLN